MPYSAFCRFVIFCGSPLPVNGEDCLQRLHSITNAPATYLQVSWKQRFEQGIFVRHEERDWIFFSLDAPTLHPL